MRFVNTPVTKSNSSMIEPIERSLTVSGIVKRLISVGEPVN